jgi:hypothetical protein
MYLKGNPKDVNYVHSAYDKKYDGFVKELKDLIKGFRLPLK